MQIRTGTFSDKQGTGCDPFFHVIYNGLPPRSSSRPFSTLSSGARSSPATTQSPSRRRDSLRRIRSKPAKKSYDIRRWTKQTPLAFVSTMRKHNSADKVSDGDK
nr:guard cell S-type anion channel SLAC1 [Ipomoea batatas]